MKKKILDTNVLLDYPQIVTKNSEKWAIPICVLEEIDQLKKSASAVTAEKARRAAVYISKNMDNIEWIFYENSDAPVDDRLLEITTLCGGTLITNDVALKVRAMTRKIDTKGYSWDNDYTGVFYVETEAMTETEYGEMLSQLMVEGVYNSENETQNFICNEYLIIPPYYADDEFSIFKFNGERFNLIRGKEFENEWCGRIFPRNPEQICLVDALLSGTPILYAGGPYGTGKSYLTHNYAISELEKQHIKKIVYVPNNSYTQNTMELGALPGSLLDKALPSIGPLVDLVGIDQINRWIEQEQLEVVPMAYMRGRSFDDSIVLVSEAENLTEEHIKLLLARCGKNTRIFFDGDIHQADSAIFKDRNGLKLLLNLHDSPYFSKLFSTVRLSRIERSEVACAADYLDSV